MVFSRAERAFISNITSYTNRLLLLVKRLAMLILTKKYRIRQQEPTGNNILVDACFREDGGHI
jgi:hypothetical protein